MPHHAILHGFPGSSIELRIPRLSESEIASLGHLPWETYREVRNLAASVSPGARCFVHALEGTGPLTAISLDPVLLSEAAKGAMNLP